MAAVAALVLVPLRGRIKASQFDSFPMSIGGPSRPGIEIHNIRVSGGELKFTTSVSVVTGGAASREITTVVAWPGASAGISQSETYTGEPGDLIDFEWAVPLNQIDNDTVSITANVVQQNAPNNSEQRLGIQLTGNGNGNGGGIDTRTIAIVGAAGLGLAWAVSQR